MAKNTKDMNEAQVTKVSEIARTISKNKEFDSELRKQARSITKMSKAARAKKGTSFLEAVAKAMGYNRERFTMDLVHEEVVNRGATKADNTPKKKTSQLTKAIEEIEAKRQGGAKGKAKAPAKAKPKATQKPAPAKKAQPKPKAPAKATPKPVKPISMKDLSKLLGMQEGEHLGDLCGWHLSGSRSVEDVADAAIKWGLTEDLQLPKLSPNSCYRKAVREVFQTGKSDERQLTATLVEDSSDRLIHSIVRKDIVDDPNNEVSDRDAEFQTEMKVGFNKAAHRNGASPETCVVLEKPEDPAAIRFKDVYLELATKYLVRDIRLAFQIAFKKWDACGALPHGGLWFVPSNQAHKVRAWRGFMGDLGYHAAIFPQFDTKETIDSLRVATQSGLEGQIQEIMNFLEVHYLNRKGHVKSDTLEKRMADFDDIRNRAELYERLLGNTMDELKDKVAKAQAALAKQITKIKKVEEKETKERDKRRAKAYEERKAARRAERAEAKANSTEAA